MYTVAMTAVKMEASKMGASQIFRIRRI